MDKKQRIGMLLIVIGGCIGFFISETSNGVQLMAGASVALGIGLLAKWISFKKITNENFTSR